MITYFADYILVSAHPLRSYPVFLKNAELSADKTSGRIIGIRSIKNYKNKRKNKFLFAPGFINAHAHTDLTFQPDISTPRIFSKWVLSLIEKRSNFTAKEKIDLRIKSFASFIKSGTTSVSDIIDTESLYDIKEIKEQNALVPRVKAFIELRGLDPKNAFRKIKDFQEIFKKNSFESIGISPHSIYSVSEKLFQEILKLNNKLKLKIAIHASEHAAEKDFISGKGGDIAENLLPALNLSRYSLPQKLFKSPIFYLDYLKILNSGVSLIHANEIDDEDIDLIAKSGADIIHCPRSNAFFNSEKLPLKKILEKGISVSIGTDGLYSNESLNILDELKYAKNIHPEVSAKDLINMATAGGAKALALRNVTGTLEPDSMADFTVFNLGDDIVPNEDNVYDLLISFKQEDILAVAIGGNIVYKNYKLSEKTSD
ncbi:MAG: amidohydrolase family protein [Candidatus Acidulodesulfobacterium sp.]